METKKKFIETWYDKKIRIGYCNAQYLLHYQERKGYTCGVYGWNADIYDIDGVAIITGYRTFGNYRIDYDLLQKYETKAEKIVLNRELDETQKKRKVNKLLKGLIKKVLEE